MKNSVDLGFLTANDFIKRRSVTLIKNPQAKLEEKHEVKKYFSQLDPEYQSEINSLSQSNTQPLSKSVRAIVTIIAYNEGSKIGKTLENYLNQDIDPSQFEIIILDNHPHNIERDNTYSEVQKFQNEHPNIAVLYTHKVWRKDEIATVGNARKYVFDIALSRLYQRGSNSDDTILISNDADTVGFDTNYLRAIVDEFNTNTTVDALVTLTVVPPSTFRKPNLFAALSLWDALDEIVAKGEPYNLRGCSTGYRASIYTAIGGFNPRAKQAEDLETGFMIADARNWNPKSVIQLKTTKQITDPRRMLEAAASRIPINEMHFKFEQRPEVRNANNDELLDLIPDDIDWEMLQEDVDSFWAGRVTGMYKWRGKRFENDYKTAMNKVGITYSLQDDRVRIMNIDELLISYKTIFEKPINIIHSKPREWNQSRIDAIQEYFSSISDSAISCRKNMAYKISSQIKLLINKNESTKLKSLIREYKRFAGDNYKIDSTKD